MAATPNVIQFPEVARPDVTVVMVTYNRWDLTKEALRLLAGLRRTGIDSYFCDRTDRSGQC